MDIKNVNDPENTQLKLAPVGCGLTTIGESPEKQPC